MQDENAQAIASSKTAAPIHSFLEVGNDLLAKPDALAALLLVKNLPTTLIFCNSPSEADMVDVMLKKKGVTTSKLIGNVPFQKVAQEIQRAHNREICAIVITDVAAREVDVKGFELVVNYGIPEDPEIYLHRITGYEQAESLQEIMSLVSPLDFGNFHYLKKVAGLPFSKVEPPSAEELANMKSKILFSKAAAGDHLEDAEVQSFLSAILEHADRDKIISLLIFNTIKVLPRLQEEAASRTNESRGGRNERWGRNRDNYQNDSYGDDQQSDDDDGGDQRGRGRRERGPRESGRSARERYNNTPVQREARLYLGLGQTDGLSPDKLNELVGQAGFPADTVKRSTLRDSYSFVDVPEEQADEFIEKIQSVNWPGQDQILIKKATFINVARAERDDDAGEGSYGQDQDSYGSTEAEAPESAGDIDEEAVV